MCTYHPDADQHGAIEVLPPPHWSSPTPGESPTPTPTLPPRTVPSDSAIVFEGYGEGTGGRDLFLVEPDGLQPRRLLHSGSIHEVLPSWSPDRSKVAYARSKPSFAGHYWRISFWEPESGKWSGLHSTGPNDLDPDWHPGGDWVAYAFRQQGEIGQLSGIRVIRTDGSGETRTLLEMDSETLHVSSPTWAPDGKSLIFEVAGSSGGTLYRWRATGIERFEGGQVDEREPSISPGGRYVAYASGPIPVSGEESKHDIWLLDLETGQRGAVASHPTWDLRRPTWSPDGEHLVFSSRLTPDAHPWGLFIVPASGGTVRGPIAIGLSSAWAAPRPRSPLVPPPDPTQVVLPVPFPSPPDSPSTLPAPSTPGPPPTFPATLEPLPTLAPTDTTTGEVTPSATSEPTASPGPTETTTATPVYLPLGVRRNRP